MNEEITREAGLGKHVDDVKKGLCPFCGKEIDPSSEFRDSLSKKEYKISGLCQKCQDEMFV